MASLFGDPGIRRQTLDSGRYSARKGVRAVDLPVFSDIVEQNDPPTCRSVDFTVMCLGGMTL
jgi:hypothetical protein